VSSKKASRLSYLDAVIWTLFQRISYCDSTLPIARNLTLKALE